MIINILKTSQRVKPMDGDLIGIQKGKHSFCFKIISRIVSFFTLTFACQTGIISLRYYSQFSGEKNNGYYRYNARGRA